MGNVGLFELCETEPKMHCTECLLYWKLGIIYCTCGHLLDESEANRGAIQCTLDLLSIPNYVKKGRLHGHRYGKLQNEESIKLPIIWERDASRRIFKGSAIVLWKIMIFVHLTSDMIELKRSVSRWTSLRKKISAIIWRKQNTFDTARIGGSLSIMTEHLNEWKSFWLQRGRCPHYNVYTKNLENDNSDRCQFWKCQYWHQSSSSSSKTAEEDAAGFAKTFPDIPCVPNAWRPFSAARHSYRTASHSTRNWMRWERHRLTSCRQFKLSLNPFNQFLTCTRLSLKSFTLQQRSCEVCLHTYRCHKWIRNHTQRKLLLQEEVHKCETEISSDAPNTTTQRWRWCHGQHKELHVQWCPMYHHAEASTSSL